MQACDVFELVYLDKDFVAENKAKLAANPLIDETVMARVNDGIELAEIERLVSEEHSEGLYHHEQAGRLRKARPRHRRQPFRPRHAREHRRIRLPAFLHFLRQ